MKPYASRPLLRARFQPHVPTFMASPMSYQAPVVRQTADLRSTSPATNMIRLENGYQIQIAIPGIPKNQIQIQVVEDQLVVSATNQNQETKTVFIRQEFDYSGFKKTFTLHKNADLENLKASFDQGILLITIPDKMPETRKIEIV